jgi:hypothetical protein
MGLAIQLVGGSSFNKATTVAAMSQIRTSRGIAERGELRARDDEGDRALERGVGAVRQAVAAVVGADEHDGARGHAGGVDRFETSPTSASAVAPAST